MNIDMLYQLSFNIYAYLYDYQYFRGSVERRNIAKYTASSASVREGNSMNIKNT